MLKDLPIRIKFFVGFALPVIIGIAAIALVFYVNMMTVQSMIDEKMRLAYTDNAAKEMSAKVDIALSLLDAIRKSEEGKPEEEVKKIAIERIKNLRFGKDAKSYFWLHTFDKENPEKPVMVMHPILTQLDGKELLDFVDRKKFTRILYQGNEYASGAQEVASVKETNLFVEMNKTIAKNSQGIVQYYWPDPMRSKEIGYAKMSYVRLYPAFHWVIGTGEYIDNIETLLSSNAEIFAKKSSESFFALGFIIVLVSLVVVILWYYIIENLISKKLIYMYKGMLEMEKGNLDFPIDYKSEDEVGKIASGIRHVCRQEKKKIALADVIAGGDLTVRPEISSDKDQFAFVLIKMIENLTNIVSNITTSVSKCSDGANEVNAVNHSLLSITRNVSNLIEKITESMQQISVKTTKNSSNAENAKQYSTEMLALATKGKDNIENTANTMNEIYSSSKQISSIIKIIDEIAFQTNLLALNAAVEAARAGRHGKGFAVVAEEVRNLASRSAKSAKESAELIAKSQQLVENGQKITKETETSFMEILDQIGKVTEVVNNIAFANFQQVVDLKAISQDLEGIKTSNKENVALVEQSVSCAESLAEDSAYAKKQTEMFKIKS